VHNDKSVAAAHFSLDNHLLMLYWESSTKCLLLIAFHFNDLVVCPLVHLFRQPAGMFHMIASPPPPKNFIFCLLSAMTLMDFTSRLKLSLHNILGKDCIQHYEYNSYIISFH